MDILKNFLDKASVILKKDERILGVCAGGSWITKDTDEYSDLDLVIVSSVDISDTKKEMIKTAGKLGNLIAAFTGEHVGEKHLLICLYENPLIHVDLKFVQLDEFGNRVENPVIIWERELALTKLISRTTAIWPQPDFQWIEDRFWVWIHYIASKLGRGELFEAVDNLSFLRINVLGPLLHLKYKSNPRGVRKLEAILDTDDLNKVKETIPLYTFGSIKSAVYKVIELYKELREQLFEKKIIRQKKAESAGINYLDGIGKIK